MFGNSDTMHGSSSGNILVQEDGFWDKYLLFCDVVWTVYTQELLDEEGQWSDCDQIEAIAQAE